MGYYTYYSLEVHGIKNKEEHKALQNLIADNYYGLSTDNCDSYDSEAYFPASDETKWYEHEEDMIKISQQFPNMTFCLEGIGEDREDMWRKYFHNGVVDYCPAHISYLLPTKVKWDD